MDNGDSKNDDRDLPLLSEASYQVLRSTSDTQDPPALTYLLEIEEKDLSRSALEALEFIRSDATLAARWRAFSYRLAAFKHVQDILGAPLHKADDLMRMFHVHYFYYESSHLLKEAVLCGLAGHGAASNALVRPMLEFVLLHNYYVRLIDERANYAPVVEYFQRGTRPSWNTLYRHAVTDAAFCKPVRFRVQQHMDGLSDSSAHPYHPEFSRSRYGRDQAATIAVMGSWQLIDFILEGALWVYYVNYPMLFFPVDVLRRFGYSGPVGVLIDETGGFHVRQSLSPRDYDAFKTYAESLQETKDLLSWVEGYPALTDEQIKATWNEAAHGPFPGIFRGYCLVMAKLRAMRLGCAFPPERLSDGLPAGDPGDAVHTYEWWAELTGRRSRER